MAISVNIAIEDDLSEQVLRRALQESGRAYKVGTRFPTSPRTYLKIPPSGYGFLKKSLPAFNSLAQTIPLIVLTDLDNNPCAAVLCRQWLEHATPHPNLIFRVAVREIEAWLLADRNSLASFLGVAIGRVPSDPEEIVDPKAAIIDLARHSRHLDVREGMVPALKSSAQVGPYYRRMMISFAQSFWDIKNASKKSESLRRALSHFGRFNPKL